MKHGNDHPYLTLVSYQMKEKKTQRPTHLWYVCVLPSFLLHRKVGSVFVQHTPAEDSRRVLTDMSESVPDHYAKECGRSKISTTLYDVQKNHWVVSQVEFALILSAVFWQSLVVGVLSSRRTTGIHGLFVLCFMRNIPISSSSDWYQKISLPCRTRVQIQV